MRVHVVCADLKSDWIIARLAQHLTKYNGWKAARRPDPKADVNVYFPYIERKHHSHPVNTRSVAFVTHKEGGIKGNIWQRLMPKFDLRICMARMYARELEPLGKTVHIPICVELDKFTPKPLPDREKPRIGVAGTVYRSGRKGEELALKLKRHNSHRWEMVATSKKLGDSKDWPIQTRFYPWSSMEKFYWGLNVFLCTSVIEGGPVTVLEALACGRPVVMPIGVGIEEELTENDGVYRYPVGDYAEMVKAIEAAVATRSQPEDPMAWPNQLRAYVQERTPERWARSWRNVIEAVFAPKAISVPEQPWKPLAPITEKNAGVYVVAYGRHAHDCAFHLIRTIHKYSPGIPVCLACEGFRRNYEKPVIISGKGKGDRYDDKGYCEPLDSDDDALKAWQKILEATDIVLALPMKDRRARSQKTKIWELAPKEWEYVLYLDADILVSLRLNFFFDLLRDGWDMVVTMSAPEGPLVRHAQRAKYKDENTYTTRMLYGNHWLQIAGGVWAFRRNERTEKFLTTFHAEWKEWQHTDQQAMMRAFWKVPVRMWILGTEFNTFMHHVQEAPRSLGIRHFATAARAWTVRHDGRSLWRKWSKKL